MNYRHAYHAGNFADVLKHAVLSFILDYMKSKEAPFFVLDTHAGLGCYDLASVEALKTGEAQQGIAALWDNRPNGDLAQALAPLMGVLDQLNPTGVLKTYPGSPEIIRQLIRGYDRAHFCEMHPEDTQGLARRYAGVRHIRVEKQDGWKAVTAHLPPQERRGLILIDPPYEQPDEYVRLSKALAEGYRRFATGTYVLWYPVKGMEDVNGLTRAIRQMNLPKTLKLELHTRKPNHPKRFDGCGLFVINPPYTLAPLMERALPQLAARFEQGAGATSIVEWMNDETGVS